MFAPLLRNALIKTLSLRCLASSRERWSLPGPEELKGSRIPMLQTCQAYGSSLPPVWKWSTCHGSGSKWEELWSTRTHWTVWGNSILLTTAWLQFTLCSDIRKNFMCGQSQKKFPLVTFTQRISRLRHGNTCSYSRSWFMTICQCSLSFHPVYPLGVQALDESHTQCYLPRCPTSGSKEHHTGTIHWSWPRSRGGARFSWAENAHQHFKWPHPTPPAWDGFWAWGLHPKNPRWEISKAASVLLKSLGIVAARGQVVPNVLQVLHISQNAIYACLQWVEVAPLPTHSLLQLWHQRPQLAVDLGLGSKKLLLQ